jgi:hypothetical protein
MILKEVLLSDTYKPKEVIYQKLLTDNEQDLIQSIRKIGCSYVKIYVQNRIPICLYEC